MDVLYVVGTGSGHDNCELRWSLRSLDMFAENLGRVVVAGYPPEWLSAEVVRVDVPDDPGAAYKHVNIMNCILECCRRGVVRGEFLYSSDDHFLCRQVDLDAYPYFYKSDSLLTAEDLERQGRRLTPYRQSLAETRVVLEANGYEPREWSGHVNTHMDAQDAPEVARLVEFARDRGFRMGLEPTCCFMAVRHRRSPVVPTFRADVKAKAFRTPAEFVAHVGGRDAFSIGDRVFSDPVFAQSMDMTYDEKSRFEA